MTLSEMRRMEQTMGAARIVFVRDGLDLDGIGSNVCSFLNGNGGVVVVGCGEGEEFWGEAEMWPGVEGYLRESIFPKSYLTVEKVVGENGKSGLQINVPAGSDLPYAYDNTVYLRDKRRGSYKADAQTVRELVLRGQSRPERWECRFSTADAESDLDAEECRRTIDELNRVGRMTGLTADSLHSLLVNLSLLRCSKLTNAGDILFAAHPEFRHPQIRMRAVSFLGDKADDRYLDMQVISGPLCVCLERAYGFIMRNVGGSVEFTTGQLTATTQWKYPPMAVREALVNAIAHRDYAHASGGVSVYVYPNRLEIWNSGRLPEGVTVSALGKDQVSRLRNPNLSYLLYLRGLMEQVGRGSILMVKACRDYGIPPPRWEVDNDGVRVVFESKKLLAGMLAGALDGALEKKIFDVIMKNPGINRTEIMANVSGGERTLARSIAKLAHCGLIERRGGKRYGGYYAVNENV